MKIKANGITVEVEDSGADGRQAQRPVVLLIMGLGMQLVAWPPEMVQALQDQGFRVIRLDNRDIGLSQHFDALGTPNVLWASLKLKLGLPLRAPYTLADMADDAVGVLDALGVRQAHVLGVSMGGMIAQHVALRAPERVLSLTSVMSSSGARGLPAAQPQVLRALFRRPAGNSLEAIAEHFVGFIRLIGSPAYPVDAPDIRERVLLGLRRSYHPAGTLRQMVAIGADTGLRARLLGRIACPTLVVHGRADPLVPWACGEDTARRIPGARLVTVEGMGHDLPPGVVQHILHHAVPHMKALHA